MEKKFLAFFIAILALLGLYATLTSISKKTGCQSNKQDWLKNKDYFTQELKKEEIALYQEIEREFGVKTSQLKADYSQQWRKEPGKPTSVEPIYKLIYNVAKEYNFNADKLTIMLQNTNAGSPAYSNNNGQLTIEMNIFAILPEQVQKFIIAHELQHILQSDSLQILNIKHSINPNTINQTQKNLLEKFKKFQEKRADFYAALQGEEWAHGYVAFAQEGIKRCKSGPGNDHPTWEDRAQWAQEIVNYMHNLKIV